MDRVERHQNLLAAMSTSFVDGLRLIAPECLPVAGGLVGRGRPGRWVNLAVSLGVNGPLSDADVATITAYHAAVGAEPRVELVDEVDKAVLLVLASAGYRLHHLETAFAIDLTADLPPLDERIVEQSANIRAGDDAADGYILATERGFSGEEDDTPEAERAEWRHHLRLPGVRSFGALIDGAIVGAGSSMVTDARPGLPRVAMLFAGSVREPFRRRGLHAGLIAARLRAARDDGCDAAIVFGPSGGATTRNARRLGMTPLCVLSTLHRPGDGLTSSL